jgi:acetyltransferase-like isoleucine patch superfamily enzyme
MVRKLSFYKIYGFYGTIKMIVNLLKTRLFYAKARLIRFPIDIRGQRFIEFNRGFTTGVGCRLEAYPVDGISKVLKFGNNVQVNDYIHITAMKQVSIGNNTLIASKVYISDCSHGSYNGNEFDSSPLTKPIERPYQIKPVTIENNVWIGEFVTILPGVTIGQGSIIGANSVVSKSIPANCIAVGSPAKPIKKFNFETQCWEKIIY